MLVKKKKRTKNYYKQYKTKNADRLRKLESNNPKDYWKYIHPEH